MCLCVCVCLSMCSRWFLSHVKFVWGVWGIIGTGLVRECCILSFTQYHTIPTQFHSILAISAIFGPISTCWVSKCMYSSWEIQWRYFHTHSCTPSCNFTQFSHSFTQFWLFQPFLVQFQHAGYQNACTWAKKVNGKIFMHFHTLLHTLSCNFHVISHNFGFLSRFWANFNMLGIKMCVLELSNSMVILSCNFHTISGC